MIALGLPLPIAATSSFKLENTQDKSKIELCKCACQPLVSKPQRTMKKVRLWYIALAVEGDFVLDFCLE